MSLKWFTNGLNNQTCATFFGMYQIVHVKAYNRFKFVKCNVGLFSLENEYNQITGRAFPSIDEAKKEFEQVHSNLLKLINIGE